MSRSSASRPPAPPRGWRCGCWAAGQPAGKLAWLRLGAVGPCHGRNQGLPSPGAVLARPWAGASPSLPLLCFRWPMRPLHAMYCSNVDTDPMVLLAVGWQGAAQALGRLPEPAPNGSGSAGGLAGVGVA